MELCEQALATARPGPWWGFRLLEGRYRSWAAIPSVMYADDIVIFANSQEEVQKLVNIFNICSLLGSKRANCQ